MINEMTVLMQMMTELFVVSGELLRLAAAAKPGRCDIHQVASYLAVSYTSLCA